MNFADWAETVPEMMRKGPLWSFEAYRLSLFLYDLAWEDCNAMLKDVRGREVAAQLIRSAGSISANIEEGYGRGYGRDYAYKLRIAIGEARETQGSYFRARRLLAPETLSQRLSLLNDIISRLVAAQRSQSSQSPRT